MRAMLRTGLLLCFCFLLPMLVWGWLHSFFFFWQLQALLCGWQPALPFHGRKERHCRSLLFSGDCFRCRLSRSNPFAAFATDNPASHVRGCLFRLRTFSIPYMLFLWFQPLGFPSECLSGEWCLPAGWCGQWHLRLSGRWWCRRTARVDFGIHHSCRNLP